MPRRHRNARDRLEVGTPKPDRAAPGLALVRKLERLASVPAQAQRPAAGLSH